MLLAIKASPSQAGLPWQTEAASWPWKAPQGKDTKEQSKKNLFQRRVTK
jgi:hypothetical protein